ncbi:hypothetical protein [Oceanobacillus saliphilus]|nr:hypothetical protein [Oceanobacillus saliphilus]
MLKVDLTCFNLLEKEVAKEDYVDQEVINELIVRKIFAIKTNLNE